MVELCHCELNPEEPAASRGETEIPGDERSAPGIRSVEDGTAERRRGAGGRFRETGELRRETGARFAERMSRFMGRTVHSVPPLGGCELLPELDEFQRRRHERQDEDQQSQQRDGAPLRVERRLLVAHRGMEEADQEDHDAPDPPP